MQERTRAGLAVARTRQKGGRRPLQPEDPRVWMAYTMYGDQRFTVLDIGHTFTQEAVITRILRHVKLAAVPPLACPCAPRSVRLGGIRHPRHQAPRAVGSTPRCLRRRAWSRGRCACNGGVSLEWTTPLSVCHPVCNPSPQPPFPEAFPPRRPWRSSHPPSCGWGLRPSDSKGKPRTEWP
jgi:hypothetical protein